MAKNIDNKEIIAETFKKHFNYFGYKKTSVDEVAKELKMSKKTIYQFFNSKEKIFYYIVNKIAIGIRIGLEKELEPITDYNKKIEFLLIKIFEKSKKWLKKNDVFEFKYKYEIGSLAFKDAFGELLFRIIELGMEAKEFKQSSVELKTRFIQGVISEGMDIISNNPDEDVVGEVVRTILKILH